MAINKEQARENIKTEVEDIAERKIYYTGRDGRKPARRNPINSSDINLWSP